MARREKKILNSFEHEQLFNASKTLLANIRFASLDNEVKSLVVTSTAANEGKTITATNLAYTIATSGRTVLIVEADMHYRSLHRLLNQHPEHGMYAALSKTVPLEKVIVSTYIPNLYFMDAEPNIASPADILATKRCASLVRHLSTMFDYVIFDTPPLSLFVDAAILSSMVDGTLFVVRENKTKRALAQRCVQQLRVANANILGQVITFCKQDESLYYYAYYTQDGRRAEKDVEKVVPKHSSRRPVAQVAPLRTLVPVLERTERRDADEPVAEIETEAFQSEQVVPADEVESVDEAMWDGFDGLPEQVEPDRSDELLEPDSPVEPLASVEPPEPVEPPKPVASAKRKKPSKKPKPVPPVEDDEPTGTDAGNSIYTPKSYKKSPKQKKHTT